MLLLGVSQGKVDKEIASNKKSVLTKFDFNGDNGLSTDCCDYICRTAKVFVGTLGPRPTPRQRGPAPAQPKQPLPKPKKGETCLTCLQDNIGPGIPHPCRPSDYKKNLEKRASEVPNFREQLAAKTIREKVAEAPASSKIELNTGGAKL